MSSSTLITILGIALLIASGHSLPTGLIDGALDAEVAVGPLAASAGANVVGEAGLVGANLRANLGGVGAPIGGMGGSVAGAVGSHVGGILRPLGNFVHNVGNLFNDPLAVRPPLLLNGAGLGGLGGPIGNGAGIGGPIGNGAGIGGPIGNGAGIGGPEIPVGPLGGIGGLG